ncbi:MULTISPECIES: hypothetical protein [unclassified Methylobacterium]|uniref:hypothetical protein n=1 Tax=unclassified Methylobacterium TaxID=2615210 RepID=UPI0036FD764F
MTDAKPISAWRDDCLAAGYKPYHDRFKARGEAHLSDDQRMYAGSVQKRICDARGIRDRDRGFRCIVPKGGRRLSEKDDAKQETKTSCRIRYRARWSARLDLG